MSREISRGVGGETDVDGPGRDPDEEFLLESFCNVRVAEQEGGFVGGIKHRDCLAKKGDIHW